MRRERKRKQEKNHLSSHIHTYIHPHNVVEAKGGKKKDAPIHTLSTRNQKKSLGHGICVCGGSGGDGGEKKGLGVVCVLLCVYVCVPFFCLSCAKTQFFYFSHFF